MSSDAFVLEPLYDVREIKIPSNRRPSQWAVWNRDTKYVHRTFDSEALAWLVAGRINYSAALRAFASESEAHADGYEMDIEPDTRMRPQKEEAHRTLAGHLRGEADRVNDLDYKLKLLKKLA